MKANTVIRFLPITMVVVGLLTVSEVSAQSYYDDDIYGTPVKKTNKNNAQNTAKTTSSQGNVIYDSANDNDYNTFYGGYDSADFDVDAYNRYGSFLVEEQQAVVADTLGGYDNFQYTQRLEKFHNPDVVTGSDDEELVQMYYSTQPTSTVNIYVNNDPFFYPWGVNYGWNWGWNNWYWNNWYWNNWTWGPSWSYYGYYNPYWGYPGWSWGWGPGWGYTWAPGYNWRPVSRPGASSLHRPVGGSNVAHGIGTGTSSRPGNMGRPTFDSGNRNYYTPSASAAVSRPGNSGTSGTSRPGNSGIKTGVTATSSATINTGVRPASASVSGTVNNNPSLNNRGRNSVNSSNTSTTTKNTNSNRSNYNNSSRTSSSSRGSSFSTGSRGGGSFGGGVGGTRGGGSSGGGRGRR